MTEGILRVPLHFDDPVEGLISREWLITNGLGSFASGTLLGVNTRRHHGVFIPNLASPRGRTMLLPYLKEEVSIGQNKYELGARELMQGKLEAPRLKEFYLEWQTPTWVFDLDGNIIEKRIFMPYGHNTVYISYKLAKGESVSVKLRSYVSCRKHDSQLGYPEEWPFFVKSHGEQFEVSAFEGAPLMKMTVKPFRSAFFQERDFVKDIFYRKEYRRGLDCVENQLSPGFFSFDIKNGETFYFTVSTESWESLEEDPARIYEQEITRRKSLLARRPEIPSHPLKDQLILAADQFVILPRIRNEKNPLMQSSSDRVRTVIAGYHWFTDWGRDTMISLEGLTLCTGRYDEAKAILETFGHYVRNGLLPNHFPEGEREAIYNTVDATLWYFHAIDRYLQTTNDAGLLEVLYPTLQTIVEHHSHGTDYGIRMDPNDGLINAASEGCQLTWMDAKVDEWVVTPRRGKPVEIQALWYNALKLMEVWSWSLGKSNETYGRMAQKVRESFNARFWFDEGGYLYDVVDTSQGDDRSFRPNQIFSISLRFPVLDPKHWKSVVDSVEKRLLTPYGLRTLEPEDKNYHPHYQGNRWERDAAYHQGLVWPWLIGGFLDAWTKVYDDPGKVREFLKPFEKHLTEAGIGSVSEIFDGDSPYLPRGCIAQAWSVAEVLRSIINAHSARK